MEPQIESDITPIEHIPNSSKNEEDLVNKILNELENKTDTVQNSNSVTLENQPVLNIPVETQKASSAKKYKPKKRQENVHTQEREYEELSDKFEYESEFSENEYENNSHETRETRETHGPAYGIKNARNKRFYKQKRDYDVDENKTQGVFAKLSNMFDMGDMYTYFKFTCVAIVLYFLMTLFSSRLDPVLRKIPWTFHMNDELTYFGNGIQSVFFGLFFLTLNILLFR